jgi:predicted metalloprotease with PDZ domain
MLPLRALVLPVLSVALVTGCGDALSQAVDPIVYDISFENRAHHEATISVYFPRVPEGPLELRMSRSSPGRYALHEFAKNVYGVEVSGAGGRAVEVSRPDPHQWDVRGHGGEVTIRYTLYGDHADGTYTGIDRTHAHLNMPATFLWARGLEDRPIELRVASPEGSGWRVATQLAPTNDPYRFTAPDLAYFLDSPTEVSDFWFRSWDVDGESIRVALHHAGTEAEAERYAEAVAAVVQASRDLYGELPDFDFGSYTFLACYLPWVDGDGMEHRNSTVLTSTGSLAANMTGVLGTVAHEFFHAWSVERIRPATLEPFDFERANMSRELWFAEGFTSYFDDLILWRAGLITDESFAGRMGSIANSVTNARGRTYFSPVEMSMQAPFVDAATSVDLTNRLNTFLSYYAWGSGIGMALDLELRTRFEGLTSDHLMLTSSRASSGGPRHRASSSFSRPRASRSARPTRVWPGSVPLPSGSRTGSRRCRAHLGRGHSCTRPGSTAETGSCRLTATRRPIARLWMPSSPSSSPGQSWRSGTRAAAEPRRRRSPSARTRRSSGGGRRTASRPRHRSSSDVPG